MTTQDNVKGTAHMPDRASIGRQYPEAAARRDFNKVRRLFHPQYSYTGGDGSRKAEAAIAGCGMFTTAFPDLKVDVEQTHVGGDVVIAEFVASGSHRGEMGAFVIWDYLKQFKGERVKATIVIDQSASDLKWLPSHFPLKLATEVLDSVKITDPYARSRCLGAGLEACPYRITNC